MKKILLQDGMILFVAGAIFLLGFELVDFVEETEKLYNSENILEDK